MVNKIFSSGSTSLPCSMNKSSFPIIIFRINLKLQILRQVVANLSLSFTSSQNEEIEIFGTSRVEKVFTESASEASGAMAEGIVHLHSTKYSQDLIKKIVELPLLQRLLLDSVDGQVQEIVGGILEVSILISSNSISFNLQNVRTARDGWDI